MIKALNYPNRATWEMLCSLKPSCKNSTAELFAYKICTTNKLWHWIIYYTSISFHSYSYATIIQMVQTFTENSILFDTMLNPLHIKNAHLNLLFANLHNFLQFSISRDMRHFWIVLMKGKFAFVKLPGQNSEREREKTHLNLLKSEKVKSNEISQHFI